MLTIWFFTFWATILASSIILFGSVGWFLVCYYLKHKYLEIYRKIALSVKYDNKRLLMAAIVEHNYWEIQTKRLNQFFGAITFIVYFIETIPMQLILYIAHHPDTLFEHRIIAAIIVLTACSMVVYTNVMSTWIINAAHKPLPVLSSYMSSRRRVLSVRDRLRVQAFIERLCGPAIGYYCYDLFPMNGYEFAQYLLISGANYLLIISMF